MATSSQEPEVAVKRAILEHKRNQQQAAGFEYAVNAQISNKLGETEHAKQQSVLSRKAYRAASELQAMLDALPAEKKEAEGVDQAEG
jgi:hypothetical protein